MTTKPTNPPTFAEVLQSLAIYEWQGQNQAREHTCKVAVDDYTFAVKARLVPHDASIELKLESGPPYQWNKGLIASLEAMRRVTLAMHQLERLSGNRELPSFGPQETES